MKKLYPLLCVLFLISIGISQNKVNVNKLLKHGNKYFKENEYIPYDGIVFDISKETGNRTLQFRMIDRFKNRSYKEWYPNGEPKTIGRYLKDDSTNYWTEWYENGLIREERTFKQVLNYTEKGLKKKRKTYRKLFTYYNTGNVKKEKNYRNGKEWGLKILYHNNGNIKYKNVIYKKNGDETSWDGFEIKSGECYKNNEEVDCYIYD